MKPNEQAKQAAYDADLAADDAVKAAQLAQREAEKAAAIKRDIDGRFPDPHAQTVREPAAQEQAALLRFGPRRSRWRELDEYERRSVDLDQRRAALRPESF